MLLVASIIKILPGIEVLRFIFYLGAVARAFLNSG